MAYLCTGDLCCPMLDDFAVLGCCLCHFCSFLGVLKIPKSHFQKILELFKILQIKKQFQVCVFLIKFGRKTGNRLEKNSSCIYSYTWSLKSGLLSKLFRIMITFLYSRLITSFIDMYLCMYHGLWITDMR